MSEISMTHSQWSLSTLPRQPIRRWPVTLFLVGFILLIGLAIPAEPVLAQSCCIVRGNVDCDPEGIVDISDLSLMIDYMFISNTPLCCDSAGNTDGDIEGIIDISDLSLLID